MLGVSPIKEANINLLGVGRSYRDMLREIYDAGAATIAQDEASSVVFGMPREAIKLSAAERVLGLDGIPAAMIAFGSAVRRTGS